MILWTRVRSQMYYLSKRSLMRPFPSDFQRRPRIYAKTEISSWLMLSRLWREGTSRVSNTTEWQYSFRANSILSLITPGLLGQTLIASSLSSFSFTHILRLFSAQLYLARHTWPYIKRALIASRFRESGWCSLGFWSEPIVEIEYSTDLRLAKLNHFIVNCSFSSPNCTHTQHVYTWVTRGLQ